MEIFLYIYILSFQPISSYWASEASPTLECSIEISRDIYVVCICRGPKSVGGITWAKRLHAQSLLGGKIQPMTPVLFRPYAGAALAWTEEKHSLRNEKLKANRASYSEEQRKERLRIRREKEESALGHSQKIVAG